MTIGGFIAGIVFRGGFNTALELTNREPFYIGCREMRDNVYVVLKSTIHLNNRNGVRAKCPGRSSRPRLELAQHEWARLTANHSLECRNCYGFEYMDFTRQSPPAAEQHGTLLASCERTRIDCHEGISHRLPALPSAQADAGAPRGPEADLRPAAGAFLASGHRSSRTYCCQRRCGTRGAGRSEGLRRFSDSRACRTTPLPIR